MDPELRAALDELRRHIDVSTVETRRHFDMVGEGVRADVRAVAEGVTALSERVDGVGTNLREEILRAQRELSAMLRFSYAELDRKIQSLEARVSELGQRYGDLESRLHRLEASR
jgi:uncharacterized protein involved in exopolysaccharide biosynthesis